MPDIYFLPIKVNGGNEAILITANIEHNQIPNFIGAGENLTQGVETLKMIGVEDTKLGVQSGFAIRMPQRKFP